MDLGVSSPQIDNPIRGFSFKQDGELDMRMDQSQNLTAHYIVNNFDEKELTFIFKEYGEERFSKKISRSIVEYRENHKPIDTTLELSKIISQSVPKKDPNKDPATRVFQALRIRVNDELNDLQECLPKAFDYLKDNGRLAIISFHSLEDRIVKNFVKSKLKTDLIPKNIPIKASDIQKPEIMMIGKVIEPSDLEVKHNPRARSAKLRVIERLVNS